SGRSLRKSSSNRNGSNSSVSPKPKARRSLTPAPSIVGCDWMMRFTGRMDIGLPHFAHVPANACRKAHAPILPDRARIWGGCAHASRLAAADPGHVFVMPNTRERVAMVPPDLL